MPQKSLASWVSELYKYRILVYFFTWRYLKVRYKQTLLGIIWVVTQPLLLAVVVSLFLFRGLRVDFGFEDVPIIIPIYAGLCLWSFFDKSVNTIGDSLISNRNIMTKVYFPKAVPALGVLGSNVVDLTLALVLFTLAIIITGTSVSLIGIFFAILAVLVAIVAAMGIGLFFASLNVEYRDVSQIMPFLFRIGIFATPVLYPVSYLPESLQLYAYINPMAGAIELFRNSLFSFDKVDVFGTVISLAATLIILVIAVYVFKRKEPTVVDII